MQKRVVRRELEGWVGGVGVGGKMTFLWKSVANVTRVVQHVPKNTVSYLASYRRESLLQRNILMMVILSHTCRVLVP